MFTMYKVFRPHAGTHLDSYNKEELVENLVKAAWECYMQMTDNSPFTVVTMNSDGTQTWRGMRREEVDELQTEEFVKNNIPVFIQNAPLKLSILGNKDE